jgi:hypothetical protein
LSIIVCFVFLVPCRVAATESAEQCPETPEDETQAQELAGTLFSKAEKSYESGLLNDALKGFLCSMQIMEHENTVFNIAHIAETTTDKKTTIALLEDYASNFSQNEYIDSIKEIILYLRDSIPDTEQEPVETAEQSEPDSTLSEPAYNESSPPDKKSTRPLRLISWIAMGTGAGGLVAGGILQGAAGAAQSDAEQANSYDQFLSKKEKMENLQTGALVGFISGGVITGAGLALYLLFCRDEEQRELDIALLPHANGLILQGRF